MKSERSNPYDNQDLIPVGKVIACVSVIALCSFIFGCLVGSTF